MDNVAEEKLMSQVIVGDGCWLWQGAVGSHGYGVIRIDGGNLLTHRLSHELFIGPIPEGLCVLHTCDVRRCVRPDHLWTGTKRDNVLDMVAKGRGGVKAYQSKKTHCPAGHPYDIQLKRTNGRAYRGCSECRRLSNQRQSQRRKELRRQRRVA